MDTIIGHAKHVMRVLGKGHRESVYGRALQVSFANAMLPCRTEVCCPILYMGQIIAHGRADFVVGDYVVEIKAVKACDAGNQMRKYLRGLSHVERKTYKGLVINFNQASGKVECTMHSLPPPKVVSRFFHKV
jgi:GxxExxY protein